MKKNQVQIGGIYAAKVSGRVVAIRIDSINPHGGWNATNQATGKPIHIKSAQRLRLPSPVLARPQLDEQRTDQQDQQAYEAAVRAKGAEDGGRDKKISGLAAAALVLAEANGPMRCGDMVEKMLATGLWKTGGKTPASTLHAALCREIATKGGESRFAKAGRGLFTTSGK